MNKITSLQTEYVEYMPKDLTNGILYISKRFELAIHLCPCRCNGKVVTPLDEWKLTEKNGKVTLRPSIGNWAGERPYHAHYYITNSEIKWC